MIYATTRDSSGESVRDVFKELMIGAFLTVLVVMLFLNDIKATVDHLASRCRSR